MTEKKHMTSKSCHGVFEYYIYSCEALANTTCYSLEYTDSYTYDVAAIPITATQPGTVHKLF